MILPPQSPDRPRLRYFAIALGALAMAALPSAAEEAEKMDWVPTSEVEEAERNAQCLRCGGRYVDPLAESDPQDTPETSDIRAQATESELQGDDVYLRGGVSVDRRNTRTVLATAKHCRARHGNRRHTARA